MKLSSRKSKSEEKTGCCSGSVDNQSMGAEEKKADGSFVKVLGSGCAKCNRLEAAAIEALKQLGMEPTIEHVTDFVQIAAYGVMSTPALVIDGKVVSYGKVLKTEEIVSMLQETRG